MKIENKDVTIKFDGKQYSFTNLITNAYINKFRDSFLSFQTKIPEICFLKFDNVYPLTEEAMAMEYDVSLQATYDETTETFSNNTLEYKYIYKGVESQLKKFSGRKLCTIGFGDIFYSENNFHQPTMLLYAVLDVSSYNIVPQDAQKIVISRIDKISTELDFYSDYSEIKLPYHLSVVGLLNSIGMEYEEILPELESIGFGNSPTVMDIEYPIENVKVTKESYDTITFEGFSINKGQTSIYPSNDLYPSLQLFPIKSTYKYVIYKFRMWRLPFSPDTPRIKTEFTYLMSKEIDSFGELKLKIKYERGQEDAD